MKPIQSSRRCECGRGFVVMIRYGDSKPIQSCTHTLREYERLHGKSTAVIISKGGAQ
jgi:hypothetical protein